MNNVKLTKQIVEAVKEVLADKHKFVINDDMEEDMFAKVLKIVNEHVN